jgi:hypothetical protein
VSVDILRECVDEAACVVGDVDSMMRQRTTKSNHNHTRLQLQCFYFI